MPKPLAARLHAELARALALPDVRKKFEVTALDIRGGPPQQIETLPVREIAKWKQVVKKASLKPAS